MMVTFVLYALFCLAAVAAIAVVTDAGRKAFRLYASLRRACADCDDRREVTIRHADLTVGPALARLRSVQGTGAFLRGSRAADLPLAA